MLLYVHTGGGLGPGMGVGDGELYSTVRNELPLAQFVGGLSTSSGVKLLANRRVKNKWQRGRKLRNLKLDQVVLINTHVLNCQCV